jgi:hypothetical protein
MRIITLPIEKYPEILQKYGLAFALINYIDEDINSTILKLSKGWVKKDKKGKVNAVKFTKENYTSDIARQLFSFAMFQARLEVSKDYFSEKIINKLRKLNNYRNTLAHSSTSQEVRLFIDDDNPHKIKTELTENILIKDKNIHTNLEELLDKTIKLARELIIDIDEHSKKLIDAGSELTI